MTRMATDLDLMTEELYIALNLHDLDKFLSFHTDDVIVENIAEGMIVHGKEELRAYMDSYIAGFTSFKMTLDSCFSFGNHQCEECTVTGIHTGSFNGIAATGKSIFLRVILVREIRDRMTTRVRQYYDSASIPRQLGFFPHHAEPSPVVELRVANEQFIKAVNSLDFTTIASMIHPEAVNFLRDSAFPGEVPKGISAETYRAIIKNDFENLESMQETPVNLQFRVIGNTGIVWGYNTIATRFKGGLVQTKQSRITTTWVRSGGKWLVLCAHLSAIPSGD